jgi:Bacteriophage tail sheath protein
MATTYKTPGVFVEEIPKLPPSVAQVETAIPAFIGYTEKAEKNGESRFGKATVVESLNEFETYFGKGPATLFNTYLDATDKVVQVDTSLPYCMYDALKLFFDNGGGKCYIIAVAAYKNSGTLVESSVLIAALNILEREDEPTLIVCPDAVLTASNGLYDFQKQALAQCAKLGDRFLLCDTKPSNEATAGQTFVDRVQELRDSIGIANLKYGAAYAPYLKSSIPKTIRFRDIVLRRGTPSAPTPATLESLTSDNNILQLIQDLKNAKAAVDSISNVVKSGGGGILSGSRTSFEDEYKFFFDNYSAASGDTNKATAIKAVYAFTLKILASLKPVKDALPNKVATTPVPASSTQTVAFVLRDDIASVATTTDAVNTFKTLARHSNAFGEGTQADELMPDDPATATTDLAKALDVLGIPAADYNTFTDPAINALYADPVTPAAKNEEARKAVAAAMGNIVKFFNAVASAAASYEKTFDDSLEAAMGIYKQIKTAIAASASVLPPSGAIAGIYARVDNARGVWKAPANESINSIFGPVLQITADQQSGLNVDAVAGKSINAIRTFTGRGHLVWGARTLAGNDNEWRYVNVRRFFNMVEESSKKSTEPFVFESNDANTWVKIQGMLENFLTVLWRQGALQGAKPEHAFYVAVGLGKTMTSLDILEGRLIVEIGMAVVRPAEFIILRFSHMLAQS